MTGVNCELLLRHLLYVAWVISIYVEVFKVLVIRGGTIAFGIVAFTFAFLLCVLI